MTDDELLKQLMKVSSRLNRALDALTDGETDAIDDAAANLRPLVGRGAGDDLIRRVRLALNLSWPQLFVGTQVDQRADVVLSIGSLPMQFHATNTHGHWTRLDHWTSTPAVILNIGQAQRKFDWEKLIQVYANTYGSHTSKNVPKALDAMSRLHSDRLNLGEYLIHCAGRGVADAVNQLLDEAHGNVVVRAQRLRKLIPLTALTIRPREIVPSIDDERVSEQVQVIKLHPSPGTYLRIFVEPDPTGETASITTIDMKGPQRPTWWPL